MGDPFAVHPVILNADFLPLSDTVHNLPKVILYTFTVVANLGVVIQFLANQLVQLRPVFRCGELLQFINQRQEFHFRERSGTNHHFYQCKQFLVGKEFIHVKTVALVAI